MPQQKIRIRLKGYDHQHPEIRLNGRPDDDTHRQKRAYPEEARREMHPGEEAGDREQQEGHHTDGLAGDLTAGDRQE